MGGDRSQWFDAFVPDRYPHRPGAAAYQKALELDPTLADAWSTALLCVGETEGLRIAEAEGLRALFIHQEGEQLKEALSPAFAKYLGP